MPTMQDLMDARMIETNAIINSMRYELMDKIDDCWLAFCASGKPQETWDTFGILVHEVARGLNEGHFSFEEKRGAIKLVDRCLDNFIMAMGKVPRHA